MCGVWTGAARCTYVRKWKEQTSLCVCVPIKIEAAANESTKQDDRSTLHPISIGSVAQMFNRQGLGLLWGGGVASPLAHTRRVTALASGRLDTEASDGPFGSTSVDRRRQPRTTGHKQARSLTQPSCPPPEQAGCRCRIESNRSPPRPVSVHRPSTALGYRTIQRAASG